MQVECRALWSQVLLQPCISPGSPLQLAVLTAGTEVAWNQVRVSELVNCRDSKEERDRLFAEIRVLKQLKHKNIMTIYDSWLDAKTMSINFITELFTSGNLRQCVGPLHPFLPLACLRHCCWPTAAAAAVRLGVLWMWKRGKARVVG